MATMLACISLIMAAGAQPPAPQFPTPPLLRHTFAQDDEGWLGIGEIAKVSRTPAPMPSLHFEYVVSKTNFNALVRPLEPASLKGAQRLSFSLKADSDTTMAVMLQEKNGGRYTAVATVPKNLWQEIALAPSDFSLAQDTNDPKDPNGTLDMESVESISLVDLHVFFLKAEGPQALALFPGIVAGPRELWLKSFEVTKEALPKASLDGLERPQLSWIGMGGAALQRGGASSPLGPRALEVAYAVSPSKFAGLVRALPVGALAEKTSLSLRLAAQRSTSLLVQLEDDQGGKFDATVEVPGGRSPKPIDLVLADFKPSAESKRDKLEPRRVKQVLILDISGILESVDQNNTLWLANLEAK